MQVNIQQIKAKSHSPLYFTEDLTDDRSGVVPLYAADLHESAHADCGQVTSLRNEKVREVDGKNAACRSFLTTIHCRRFAVACPPIMDCDTFSDDEWCSGGYDWMQTPSEHIDATSSRSSFDENINHLHWNQSTSSTPAPPPFTFGFETGINNELSFSNRFSDGFSHASCDLESLFLHEGNTADWNPNWGGENSLELGNEYTSQASSSDSFAMFPESEAYLATADPSLGAGSVSATADSPPLHLWSSDDLPVSGSGMPMDNLTQYEMSNCEARDAVGWEWEMLSRRWLDEGVSSEVCHFPQPIKVLDRTKVSHVERVTGLPSQFPIPPEATAFLIDVTHIPNLDLETTIDALLKDQFLTQFGRTFIPGPDPPAVVRKLMPMFREFSSAALTPKHALPAGVQSLGAAELILVNPFHLSSPTLTNASLIRNREIG
ncbi:hypothetical protein C8R44DRAFT_734191 [Mycena epipterygia]|nr:hypothetical protein C8R44DRAFT_734191 [Mycena epipterygia]